MAVDKRYVRALAVATVALAYAGRGVGFIATDPRWGVGDAVFAATLLAIAVALARGSRSVRFLAVGLVGAELLQWLNLLGLLLLVHELPPDGETWLASSSTFALACAAAVVACWTWPEVGARRHPIALVLAGVALGAALRFSTAPGLAPLSSALALGGSLGLVVGTLGISSGRTWGLLLLLPSALLVWFGVGGAPDVIVHRGSHPWFPGPSFVKIQNAGKASVVVALATVGIYAVPIVRYLRSSAPQGRS